MDDRQLGNCPGRWRQDENGNEHFQPKNLAPQTKHEKSTKRRREQSALYGGRGAGMRRKNLGSYYPPIPEHIHDPEKAKQPLFISDLNGAIFEVTGWAQKERNGEMQVITKLLVEQHPEQFQDPRDFSIVHEDHIDEKFYIMNDPVIKAGYLLHVVYNYLMSGELKPDGFMVNWKNPEERTMLELLPENFAARGVESLQTCTVQRAIFRGLGEAVTDLYVRRPGRHAAYREKRRQLRLATQPGTRVTTTPPVTQPPSKFQYNYAAAARKTTCA